MNLVIISGRLANDPDVRYTKSGKAVANITLAVDRGFGENKQTSWIPCTAWEKTAETIGNTLAKGRKIAIEGEWTQRSWETTDGQKRRVDECLIHRFEYCDSKNNLAAQPVEPPAPKPADSANQFGNDVGLPNEEIPF